jgi:DNA-binding response OmpR family regulator
MPVALVVEDEPEISAFVIAAFRQFGCDAFAIESVEDAVEILQTSSDISVLFINLAEQRDELELAQAVSRQWPKIKLILLSARLDSLRALPPAIFMTKPTNPAAIIAIVKRVTNETSQVRPQGKPLH